MTQGRPTRPVLSVQCVLRRLIRYDVVVDIGGGNGQFLAELLAKHTGLQGVLVDQQGQVTRGKQVSSTGPRQH